MKSGRTSLSILFLSRNVEVVYHIIGKCLETDPYEHEPDNVAHVAYIPWKWLSVPIKVWMPNVNYGALLAVLSMQGLLTWVAFYTSTANYYTSPITENGCVQFFLALTIKVVCLQYVYETQQSVHTNTQTRDPPKG